MAKRGSHERFDRDDRTRMGSERGFAIVFAVVFLIIAAVKGLVADSAPVWVGLWVVLAALMLFLGFVFPRALRPLNVAWFRFGLLLHKVVSPLVMGLVFYVTVTPIGLIMRLLGKRPLRLRFDPAAESYWIERRPPGPAPGSFSNQF